MEYLSTLSFTDAGIWNQLAIGYAIAGMMGIVTVTLRLIWEPTSICRLPGGVKVEARTWMLLAAIVPSFALYLCLKLREKVELTDPEVASVGQVLRYAYLVAVPLLVISVAALATYPLPSCDNPERLAGLEKGLKQSGAIYVAAKTATFQSRGLVSQTCRALVDVNWPGSDKQINAAIWYQVILRNRRGWGSYVDQPLQRQEYNYQYARMVAGLPPK